MHYNTLQKGYRIEYTFIEDEMLKYAQTPVFETKRELNTRLKELYEDQTIQKCIVVMVTHWFHLGFRAKS